MKILNLVVICAFCFLLTACSSTQNEHIPKLSSEVYLDHAFHSDHEFETEQDIFFVSDSMKRYIDERLNGERTVINKTERLLKDLFDPEVLDIKYLHNANLTASETFEQGVANCLSLTLLSYVLVTEADLTAQFNDISLIENWTVQNGISLSNGHVNLKVFRPISDSEINFNNTLVTIDFLPMLNVPILKQKHLSKSEIMALFYNNKGANAMIAGDMGTAYHYFKLATIHGPELASPWGNLASLYRQSGFEPEAEKLYEHGIRLAPENLTIKENLALLYKKTGRNEEAQRINARILKKRLDNPYYFAMLAAQDFDSGNYRESIRQYKKANRMHDSEHQFLFGIAKNYLMLNDYERAKRYIKKARKIADSVIDKEVYRSKLSALERLTSTSRY